MIKTFHQHVAASQHGATEANESESMRALVDKLMEAERLSERQKAEVAVSSESRRMIFWNGYERAQSPPHLSISILIVSGQERCTSSLR